MIALKQAKIVKVMVKGIEMPMVLRGPLNEGDKHWGMRSNKNFLKKLGVIENG